MLDHLTMTDLNYILQNTIFWQCIILYSFNKIKSILYTCEDYYEVLQADVCVDAELSQANSFQQFIMVKLTKASSCRFATI